MAAHSDKDSWQVPFQLNSAPSLFLLRYHGSVRAEGDMSRGRGFTGRVVLTVLAVVVLYNNLFPWSYHRPEESSSAPQWKKVGAATSAATGSKAQHHSRQSLLLDERQCQAAFPLLTKEIDDAVAAGPFRFNRSVDDYTGQTHARIKDGKLYIIAASKRGSQDMIHERDAVFHQIHRAMQTSPTPLPDIVFTVSVLDDARQHVWSFSRPSTVEDVGKYWLMPHFSFWSWPKSFIGTIDQGLTNIEKVERETPWEEKISKAVWRGTVWFNSVSNLNLRPKLLQATKGKAWADVEETKWDKQGMAASNAIAIHDFCKYKYILYTEGVTYSGRLPFHQACESVILTTPPNFMLHNTHLMRPLFSTALGLSTLSSYQETLVRARWPTSYPASEANAVFVGPNWQDLEKTVDYLEKHQSVAKAIAKRQRDMMVKAGYLSAASEACYWRALIRGWKTVATINEDDWTDEDGGLGMRWETFVLKGTMDKTAV